MRLNIRWGSIPGQSGGNIKRFDILLQSKEFYKCSSYNLPKWEKNIFLLFKKRMWCPCYKILTISWCNIGGAILVLCKICAKRFVNEGTSDHWHCQLMFAPLMHTYTFWYKTFERPVEANAKHPVLAQGSKEQFVVFAPLTILGKGALCQGDLADSVTKPN